MRLIFSAMLALAAGMSMTITMGQPAAQAAPGAPLAAAGVAGEPSLAVPARWHGHRGYGRGHYRPARMYRPWRPAYRPVYVRPRPYYVAPPVYGPRVVCRVRQRQVRNGWAYVWRPVRVCWRRW